jgi:trehalose utilization protein
LKSNAERHLGNAERILALQNWHISNANQHLIIENQHLIIENQHFSNAVFKVTWISWFLTEQTFQSCFRWRQNRTDPVHKFSRAFLL